MAIDPYRSTSQSFTVNVTGATTFQTPGNVNATTSTTSAPYKGMRLELIIIVGTTGVTSIGFNASYKTQATPTLLLTDGATNIIHFVYDGTIWLQDGYLVSF